MILEPIEHVDLALKQIHRMLKKEELRVYKSPSPVFQRKPLKRNLIGIKNSVKPFLVNGIMCACMGKTGI